MNPKFDLVSSKGLICILAAIFFRNDERHHLTTNLKIAVEEAKRLMEIVEES